MAAEKGGGGREFNGTEVVWVYLMKVRKFASPTFIKLGRLHPRDRKDRDPPSIFPAAMYLIFSRSAGYCWCVDKKW